MPVRPGKVLALWNNYLALAGKLGLAAPAEPLYFMKAPSSYLNPGETIVAPPGHGKVVFEGELAIVIGRAQGVSEAEAMAHVFGYTCANDVTAADVLNRDPTFAQWVRAKGYDSFCPWGPDRHRVGPGHAGGARPRSTASCGRTIRWATCASRWHSW